MHRDENTNELIREYRDKKKRKRVTALKKAILEKRKVQKERKLEKKEEGVGKEEAAVESEYDTMYETDFKPDADEEDGMGLIKQPRYSSENEFLAYKDAFKPLFWETLNNP